MEHTGAGGDVPPAGMPSSGIAGDGFGDPPGRAPAASAAEGSKAPPAGAVSPAARDRNDDDSIVPSVNPVHGAAVGVATAEAEAIKHWASLGKCGGRPGSHGCAAFFTLMSLVACVLVLALPAMSATIECGVRTIPKRVEGEDTPEGPDLSPCVDYEAGGTGNGDATTRREFIRMTLFGGITWCGKPDGSAAGVTVSVPYSDLSAGSQARLFPQSRGLFLANNKMLLDTAGNLAVVQALCPVALVVAAVLALARLVNLSMSGMCIRNREDASRRDVCTGGGFAMLAGLRGAAVQAFVLALFVVMLVFIISMAALNEESWSAALAGTDCVASRASSSALIGAIQGMPFNLFAIALVLYLATRPWVPRPAAPPATSTSSTGAESPAVSVAASSTAARSETHTVLPGAGAKPIAAAPAAATTVAVAPPAVPAALSGAGAAAAAESLPDVAPSESASIGLPPVMADGAGHPGIEFPSARPLAAAAALDEAARLQDDPRPPPTQRVPAHGHEGCTCCNGACPCYPFGACDATEDMTTRRILTRATDFWLRTNDGELILVAAGRSGARPFTEIGWGVKAGYIRNPSGMRGEYHAPGGRHWGALRSLDSVQLEALSAVGLTETSFGSNAIGWSFYEEVLLAGETVTIVGAVGGRTAEGQPTLVTMDDAAAPGGGWRCANRFFCSRKRKLTGLQLSRVRDITDVGLDHKIADAERRAAAAKDAVETARKLSAGAAGVPVGAPASEGVSSRRDDTGGINAFCSVLDELFVHCMIGIAFGIAITAIMYLAMGDQALKVIGAWGMLGQTYTVAWAVLRGSIYRKTRDATLSTLPTRISDAGPGSAVRITGTVLPVPGLPVLFPKFHAVPCVMHATYMAVQVPRDNGGGGSGVG